LVKVQKRSGDLEEFDRRKLEQSIRHAGASEEAAKRIAARIEPKEGMSTADLRRKVSEELKRENVALSGAYTTTKRLRARGSPDLKSGVVRLHEDLLKPFNVHPGDKVNLMHRENEARVEVQSERSGDPREVVVNRADLEKLGAKEGTRVNVRFPK
jgi:hypothetical protein